MSVQAMSWALEQQRITEAPARHVLLCLANYAHADGSAAFPSQAKLAADTGLNERTVRSRLAQLELLGLIRRGNQAIAAAHIAREDRRPVVYDLDMPRAGAESPRSERGDSDVATGGFSRPKRGGGRPADPRPLTIIDPDRPVDKSTGKPKRPPAETAGKLRAIGELFKTGSTP